MSSLFPQPEPGIKAVLDQRDNAVSRLKNLLRLVAFKSGSCKCGEMLYWVKHNSGATVPYNVHDGKNHFETCRIREQFKRKESDDGVGSKRRIGEVSEL